MFRTTVRSELQLKGDTDNSTHGDCVQEFHTQRRPHKTRSRLPVHRSRFNFSQESSPVPDLRDPSLYTIESGESLIDFSQGPSSVIDWGNPLTTLSRSEPVAHGSFNNFSQESSPRWLLTCIRVTFCNSRALPTHIARLSSRGPFVACGGLYCVPFRTYLNVPTT